MSSVQPMLALARHKGRRGAIALTVLVLAGVVIRTGHAQQVKIGNVDPSPAEGFGLAVAIEGLAANVVVVGAPDEVVNDRQTGGVHLFDRNRGGPGNWSWYARLLPSDAVEGDRFGRAVSLFPPFIAVGAPEAATASGISSGAAYVFHALDPAGPWLQRARLAPDDGMPMDFFGTSVAIGSAAGRPFVVVGAPGQDAVGLDSGAAYIFVEVSGGAWAQAVKLVPSDGAPGDRFGAAVAASGDVVIVGAPGADVDDEDEGAAYVFSRDHGGAGRWGEVVKLTKTDEPRGELPERSERRGGPRDHFRDEFGAAVGIAGDTAVVGAPGEDGPAFDSGAAYIFDRASGGPDRWGQVAEITASGAARQRDLFGAAVAIQPNRVVLIGAPGDDTRGEDAGAVYLFGRSQGGVDAWGRIARILAFDGAAGDAFGQSVALPAFDSRTTGVAGAPTARGLVDGSGAAYVLDALTADVILTLEPIADSFVRRNAPDRNEGANELLRINESGRNRAVLDFGDIPNIANVTRATLVLTIAENSNNWGRDGRTVEAFRIAPFVEGNGKDAGVRGSERTRGSGEGITWNCHVDAEIENDRPDCGEPTAILEPIAEPVLHTNGLRGEVSWDVSIEVINGTRAWMIRKTDENRSGEVWYYSKEGAHAAGNPDLAPRLVLEFARRAAP